MTAPTPPPAPVVQPVAMLQENGFAAFLLVFFLLNVGMGVFPPLLPQVMESLDLSFAAAGLLGTAFGLTRFIADLPIGLLVERLGFRRILHAGMGLFLAGNVLSAAAPSFAVMALARGLMGLASGTVNVVGILYLMHTGSPAQRSRRGNLYELSVIAGMAVSADLAGMIGGRWGWRWSFWGASAAFLAAWATAARVSPALARVEANLLPATAPPPVAAGPRRPGAMLAIYVAMFAQAFAWGGGISTLLPLYGGRGLELPAEAVGRSMAIAFWAEVGLLFPVGWAADAWGKVRILLPGFGAILAGVLLVPASAGSLTYGAAFVLLTSGMSVWMLVPALLREQLGGDFRGRSAGLYRLVTDLGFILAPALVGWLIGRQGFTAGALAIALVVALSILLSLRYLSRRFDAF
ncbi:MAG: MFS transporter [Candidatus Methylomirabilales bacterium]